jgi:hypothetical protein
LTAYADRRVTIACGEGEETIVLVVPRVMISLMQVEDTIEF